MSTAPARDIGLVRATGVGIGAIVGGGIFVLAGAALEVAGPAAVVAFALNAVVAVLTALSFAELGTAFPQNGGSYRFARTVLGVQPAFAAGWILWFAYIVAAVLYSLGFAEYTLAVVDAAWTTAPAWLTGDTAVTVTAIATLTGSATLLGRYPGSSGDAPTIGKLVVFGIVLIFGTIAMMRAEPGAIAENLTPFFRNGASGLLTAMGLTFIAVQGFELVTAIGGQVRDPRRNIPRAMLLSLAVTMVVYLPLLVFVSGVGVPSDYAGVHALAAEQPETIIATAAETFMGPFGRWLIMIAAILATLSAMQACQLAGAAIAASMARDRTLPSRLGRHNEHSAPIVAIWASFGVTIAVLLVIPDLGAAGAAASLIFLLSFALTHMTAYLARQRGSGARGGVLMPWFPAVQVVGGLACTALCVFQMSVAPAAGAITAAWLCVGAAFYGVALANRAEVVDAAQEAQDPELLQMRGRSPLVLVPVANPAKAGGLIHLANAVAPPNLGRVLLFTAVQPRVSGEGALSNLEPATRSVFEGLAVSVRRHRRVDALITVSDDPWKAIVRVAKEHGCESIVVGVHELRDSRVEWLMSSIEAEICVLRAPDGWNVDDVSDILVPIAGAGHDRTRARLLNSLQREHPRAIRYLRLIPEHASESEEREARASLRRVARDEVGEEATCDVVRSADIPEDLARAAQESSLVVLGVQRLGRSQRIFGGVAERIAEGGMPLLMLSGR